MLLEDKVDFILNKQGPKALEAYEKDRGQGKPKDLDAKGVIKTLADWSEKNLQWLVNMYIKGQFSLEDKARILDVITDFNKEKKGLEKKDLNQYKTIDEIETTIKQHTEENQKRSKAEDDKYFKAKEATKFYEGGGITVIVPKSQEASCYFGMNTKWCTARKDEHNQYGNYSKRGNLYIVFLKDGRKYQFYFRKGEQQFADEKDHMLNDAEFATLTKEVPALYDAFEKVAKKTGCLALIKEPTDADILPALKNELTKTLKLCETNKKILSKEAAEYALEKEPQHLLGYPSCFTREYAIEFLKKNVDRDNRNAESLVAGWLTKNVKDVTEKEFNDLVTHVLAKKGHSFDKNALIHYLHTGDARRAYWAWVEKFPQADLEKYVSKNKDLIAYLEDLLTEKFKVDLIDKDPDLLKKFEKPTNKMKQQAQWATDRIKRQRRGF
jgi:hypothetical protein